MPDLLPQPGDEAVLLLDQVRLGAVVSVHSGDDLVTHPHTAGIDVSIVLHRESWSPIRTFVTQAEPRFAL